MNSNLILPTMQMVSERMQGYDGFWCVAGGWAIDLYLGRQTREHEDVEVVVLRSEYQALFEHFEKLNPLKILSGDIPIFIPWNGDAIESEIIQLRADPLIVQTSAIDFDLLLTPTSGDQWICRRDESMRKPLEEVRGFTPHQIPYLAPEIVLMFKAKYVREKDVLDFQNVRPVLSEAARIWLRTSLTQIHPGHEWIQQL